MKIDQQFTRNMLDSNADELIVAKVIEIAHALGLDVVAEGVESEGVWQRLAELGCDVAQGYAIARPMESSIFANGSPPQRRPWARQPSIPIRRAAEAAAPRIECGDAS